MADWFDEFIETPQQEYERHVAHYHAPDREQVLAALRSKAGIANPNASGGTPTSAWNEQTFTSAFGRPGTTQELVALEPRLQEQGITVLRNAAGVPGKIQFPNGEIVDIINSAGLGGRGFQWLSDGGQSGGDVMGSGWLSQPYGKAWDASAHPLPAFQPWGKEFAPPSLDEIRNTPGYEFTRDEGIKAIDRGAAAQGTILSGGHNQDLSNYVTGLADQYAQRAFDNKLTGYRTNFDTFKSDNNDRFAQALQGKSSALNDYMTMYNVVRNDKNDIFGRFDRIADRGVRATDAATS